MTNPTIDQLRYLQEVLKWRLGKLRDWEQRIRQYDVTEEFRLGALYAVEEMTKAHQLAIERIDKQIAEREGPAKLVLIVDNTRRKGAEEGGPKAS